ncbi:MAG: hypothetical protein QXH07_06095, partial [Thermoplasmata archaeon]
FIMRKGLTIVIIVVLCSFSIISIMPSSSHAQNIEVAPYLAGANNTSGTTTTVNTQNFYVLITSSYPGQSQEMTLPLNSTGYMMYPNWSFYIFSDVGNTSYQIFLNGAKVASGTFIFKVVVPMNVSSNFANVAIILSSPINATVYNFYNVPILHTSLKQYYTPAPVELPVYTISQFTEGLLRALLVTVVAVIGSTFFINGTYIRGKKINVVIR